MHLHRALRGAVAAAAFVAVAAGCTDGTPRVGPAEQAAFDRANQPYLGKAWTGACEGFSSYLVAHSSSALAREAKVKRAIACLAAQREPARSVDDLHDIADGRPHDYPQALAAMALAARGERDRQGEPGAYLREGLDGLERQARSGGGRWAEEARARFVEACFGELERTSSPELADRILAVRPAPRDRDRARFEGARRRLRDPARQDDSERVLLDLVATSPDVAPDALWELGTFHEGRGEYAQAVARYEALLELPRSFDAAKRLAEIRKPELGVSVAYVEVPGARPEVDLTFRNHDSARLVLRRADPLRQDPAAMLEGNGFAGAPGETIKDWTEALTVPGPHQRGTRRLVLEVEEPGSYSLDVTAGAMTARASVLVTPLASVLKMSRSRAAVWTVDARTGAAVPHAAVALYLMENGTPRRLEKTADAGGLALFEVDGAAITRAVAWSGRDGAWAVATDAARHGFQGEGTTTLVYVLTDRPLYKPGEKVGVKVFARSRGHGPSVPVAELPLSLSTVDPSGREIDKRSVVTNAFGSASYELALGAGAPLGAYQVNVGGEHQHRHGRFRVEEHKPPEFSVRVEPLGKAAPGEKVRVQVSAAYLFGGPVAGADGRAVVTPAAFSRSGGLVRPPPAAPPPAPPSQETIEAGPTPPSSRNAGPAVVVPEPRQSPPTPERDSWAPLTIPFKTDQAGAAILEIPWFGSDRTFHIQVFLTDASRREVTGQGSVNASSSPFFVKLAVDRVLYRPGERITARLEAEDANGRPESPALEVRMVRLGENGAATEILRQIARLEDGHGRAVLEGDAVGPVRLEVRPAEAPAGTPAMATADLWLSDSVRPINPPGAGFQVISDTAPRKVGGTVRALVVTRAPGGHVLASLEGDDLYQAQSIEVRGRGAFLELPLTAAMAPNVQLVVARVEEADLLGFSTGLDVEGGDAALEVAVRFPVGATAPGSTLPLEIGVTPARSARPAAAAAAVPVELSVSVVDEALYAIEAEPTDLMSFLGPGRQGHRVSTAVSFQQQPFRPLPPPAPLPGELAVAGAAGAEEAAAPRSAQKADRHAPSPEAAAPAAAGPPAPPVRVRSDFGSSAGWHAASPSATGRTARLQASFTDSLTSWRATAIALTPGPLMGVGRGTVRTEMPLMVRLEAPRFFTERDEVTLTALVNSRFRTPVPVEVTFEAADLKPLGPATHRTVARAAGEARAQARFRVETAGQKKVRVVARSGRAADAMELTLPAVIHGSAQRQAFAGRIADQVELSLDLPARRNRAGTRFELTVSPSLIGVMLDSLPFLAQYPYGCTEQTLSRFVPAAIAAKVVNRLGLPPARVPANLDGMIADGLERLYGYQHGDGGWGWWKEDGSNRSMSAYAMYGLTLAREAGVAVDARVLERGRAWLAGAVVAARGSPDEHAFMTFVLASTGGAPKVELDHLYQRHKDLSGRGKALAALALLAARDGRAPRVLVSLEPLLKAAKERPEVSPGAAGDPWQTSEAVEATAWALMAYHRNDPSSPLVKLLTDFLVLRRHGGKWRTTRDTAIAVYALSEVAAGEQAASARGSFTVTVNGVEAARLEYDKGGTGIAGPIALDDRAFVPGKNTVRIVRSGAGTAYWSALWDVYSLDESIKGVGGELTLARRCTVLGRPGADDQKIDAPVEPGMPLEPGERVRVDLAVKASKAVELVMIEDFKPAGLEAVLQKSGPEVCNRACAHAELRSDRVALFLSAVPAGVTRLSYELRAETPGRFHALPARAEAMYAPEIAATSDEMRLEVRDAPGAGGGVAGR